MTSTAVATESAAESDLNFLDAHTDLADALNDLQQSRATEAELLRDAGNKGLAGEAREALAEHREAILARIRKADPPSLARDPNILDSFVKSFRACGVVGEEHGAKLLYLALTTRLLDHQVNVAVKGPSSAGKNFMIEGVLQHFPPSAYWSRTAVSPKALLYNDASWEHRFIVLFEANDLQNSETAYILRSLLSEGRLHYSTVEKDGNKGNRGRDIVKNGPTGLITSTTAIALEPEIETRLISLTLTDTPDQTKAVLAAVMDDDRDLPDLTPWQQFQEWLTVTAEGVDVTIPFGPALAELMDPIAVRLRRDVRQIRQLIKAHALLNKIRRSVDGKGRIEATIADYAAILPLVDPLISESVEASVSQSERETVEAIRTLTGGSAENPTNHKAIRDHLELDKGAVTRRMKKAVKDGYVLNIAERGRHPRYVIGDPLPEDRPILPSPDAVERLHYERHAQYEALLEVPA